jgi:hypothetical protein
MLRLVVVAFAGLSFGAAESLCDPAAAVSDKKMIQIRARAEQGYVQEQIELAAAYLSGRGVSQDEAQAAHWYLKAAESGDPEAQNQIGYFYQSGIGVRMDLERAAHWFQLASASGMPWAKVNLGVSYLHGEGVRQNSATARQLFLEAVDKGVGLGATYLGLMAYFGMGMPVDKASAAHWFETGAKLHDPEGSFDLAVLVFEGDGAGHDLRKASELLRFSAGKGYVLAKHGLGLLLVNHPEFARSEQEARLALEEASDAGNWKASIVLGVLERQGRKGLPPDPDRAFYYFDLAALQGGEEGMRVTRADLAALRLKLTREEQADLGAKAEAQFQQHPVPLRFVLKATDMGGATFPELSVTDPAP